MRRLLLLATLLATLVPAASASAGTYVVAACSPGIPNGSWTFGAKVRGVGQDGACGASNGDFIGLSSSNIAIDGGAAASMTFNAPAGSTIADFSYRRRIQMRGEAPAGPGTNKPYFLFELGATAFEGGGSCCTDKRTALTNAGHWLDTGGTYDLVGRRSYANLPDNASQSQLRIRLGCFASGATCKQTDDGGSLVELEDIRVTLQENGKPSLEVLNEGLFAPGGRNASDPIYVTASDPTGIRKVELIDATDPLTVYAIKDYAGSAVDEIPAQTSDSGDQCQPSRLQQCPQLTRERVLSLPDTFAVGKYSVFVRVTDAAGNVADSPVRAVSVTTDADRGAPNGTGATDQAALTVAQARIRARVGRKVTIGGTLTTSAGAPIGGAAIGVTGVSGVTTAPDGTWSATLKAVRSRTITVGYRAFANDELASAKARITLEVPIGATVRAPGRVRAGQRFAFRGRIQGRKPSKRQLLLVAQVKVGRTWRVIGRARTKRQTYRLPARTRVRGTRDMRVVLRPRAGFPYATGRTRTLKVRVR